MSSTIPRTFRFGTALLLTAFASLSAACASDVSASTDETPVDSTESAIISFGEFPEPGPTTVDTPIGLALSIRDGQGEPLKVRKGQRFYINQLDIQAAIDTNVDEGVKGLDSAGDFASLNWQGTTFVDQSFQTEANASNGKFTRRRFYRKARWMKDPSAFVIEQLDAQGRVSGLPWIPSTGLENLRTPIDSFFTRRLRAIQYTNDCPALDDCTGATSFREEALLELRNANGPNPSVKIGANTTKLRVRWSLKPDQPYEIPITQVAAPQWDYGFKMDVTAVTPPNAQGFYAPGQQVSFKITLRDGAGNRLHPDGGLPSYADFVNGTIDSGITYWRGPFEPFSTYYRRKHQEKQLSMAFQGPKQSVQPIRNVLNIVAALDFGTGIISVAKPETDGFFGQAVIIPNIAFVLGGPPTWGIPVSDTYTFTIPSNAQPGTYSATLKGRRSYLGEDIAQSKVVEVQVGTATPTQANLGTGPCTSCHSGGSDLGRINHALKDRSTCSSCHAPLSFELEGPAYVRVHFIHSRTERLNDSEAKCNNCHLNKPSIQRTSKSACMSCHKSYPQSHVAQFGPVVDMYVGGRTESFQQCTGTCHTNHPRSGL